LRVKGNFAKARRSHTVFGQQIAVGGAALLRRGDDGREHRHQCRLPQLGIARFERVIERGLHATNSSQQTRLSRQGNRIMRSVRPIERHQQACVAADH
jgi:hypothetical protein